jgi:hypothetical protein
MKKILFLILSIYYGGIIANAQQDTSNPIKNLPFEIDDTKKMPEFELEDKKEGSFVTGLPRLEFDPIRGFGVGGNVFLFLNKTKEDPFFKYTPYRHRINAEFFIFENGRIRYAMNYDAPYIFDSRWRLRADAVLWEDPEAQYWGIGRSTLNDLEFTDKGTGQNRKFNRLNDYEKNLARLDANRRTDLHYNNLVQREQLYNLLGERVFAGGKGRFMFGYEALFTSFSSFNGKIVDGALDTDGNEVQAVHNQTLIDKQIADGTWERFNLSGFNNNDDYMFTSMLAGALIWDTRDFEPDPSEGVFLQYSHEYSAPWLGSNFNFNKLMIQGQYIHTLFRWRNNKSRLTFAGLAAVGHIFGPNINFIEMWDLSSQAEAGGILVLGGERSLRGYREARFLAPTVALINLEMRSRLYDFKLFKQHVNLGLTPFFDCGSVWDNFMDINFQKWRGAPGLGGRIAWNQSTVIRIDYGQSREGGQFFFGFGHIF